MEIKTAQLGFCFGIERAYRGINDIAATQGEVKVFHERNKNEWDTLRRIEKGDSYLLNLYPNINNVSVLHDFSSLQRGDNAVLGFHGVDKRVKERLVTSGIEVQDLQCPFISRMDSVVEELTKEGFNIIAFGKTQSHHCLEAQRIAQEHGRKCVIVEKAEDVDEIYFEPESHWACVGAVTGNTFVWEQVVSKLGKMDIPVKIVKTVCSDSFKRQEQANQLAQEAEVVLVVDDGGGASLSVYEVCSLINERVYRIDSKEDIQREWFEGVTKVAIVGGILVPQWTIDEMASYLQLYVSPNFEHESGSEN
jgi:4-hydroxy-3-methylbut-2-enyl diphosphate reductase